MGYCPASIALNSRSKMLITVLSSCPGLASPAHQIEGSASHGLLLLQAVLLLPAPLPLQPV